MNREDIIRMAREAGFYIEHNEIYSMSTQSDHELTEPIERFAALVASAERERCAELRKELTFFYFDKPSTIGKQELVGLVNQGLDDYAKLIRTGNV
jgi:hypothetical protein